MHDEGTLQALTGGLKVKVRVQHPKILEAKFREGWMWFFRYYADDVQADGSVKTLRKKHAVGLSRGDGKINCPSCKGTIPPFPEFPAHQE